MPCIPNQYFLYIPNLYLLYTLNQFLLHIYTKSLFAIYTKSRFALYTKSLFASPKMLRNILRSLCCTYFSICDNMMKCSMMNTSYIQWRWLQIYLWEKNLYDTFRSRNVHRTSSLSVDWLLQVLTRIETLLY